MAPNSSDQIQHVSDTALMVAACRALETARADGLVRDPFAERLAGPRGDAILHLGQRAHTRKFNVQLLEAGVGQVDMRVIESRHDEMPAQVHDLRVLALEPLDLCIRADGHDAAAAHGDGLDAWPQRRRVKRDFAIELDRRNGAGQHIAMKKDRVRRVVIHCCRTR